MATDYDATRKTDDDTESLDALKERGPSAGSGGDDDVDNADGFTMPDVENEFTCTNCFLVKPHHQRASKPRSAAVCIDCAG